MASLTGQAGTSSGQACMEQRNTVYLKEGDGLSLSPASAYRGSSMQGVFPVNSLATNAGTNSCNGSLNCP